MENCRERRCRSKRPVVLPIRILSLTALLLATVVSSRGADTNQKRSVPSVDAARGPCTVDFRVIDSHRKPVAKAWIYTEIKLGFLGMRKLKLQVPTNADGRARITGLSYKIRKNPLEFRVQHGDDYKIIYHYPAGDCQALFIVALSKTPSEEPASQASGDGK